LGKAALKCFIGFLGEKKLVLKGFIGFLEEENLFF
jgi:hypothetical protein